MLNVVQLTVIHWTRNLIEGIGFENPHTLKIKVVGYYGDRVVGGYFKGRNLASLSI
jgi:hypothetical protein